LEVFREKVPIIGSFLPESSNDWKFSVGSFAERTWRAAKMLFPNPHEYVIGLRLIINEERK